VAASEKLYYSIGEVCEMTSLEAHVLRFWESEFKQLDPPKSTGGTRRYRHRDVELIQRIQHLVQVEKFTLDGARRQLNRPPLQGDEREETLKDIQTILNLLS
jgi:DNA-binding transcriptional MerR regulator